MDYAAHYDRLINRAIGRELGGYCERHHIIPRCIGGPDEERNIVRLTPEEHYVSHQLLVKILPNNNLILFAARCMSMSSQANRMQRANKLYGWLRRRFAAAMRGRTASAETRAKQSAARLGKRLPPHSAETKAKMSAASRGRAKSPAHCAAMSSAQTARFGDVDARAAQAEHLKFARSMRVQKPGPSGACGVEWIKQSQKWRARAWVKRRAIHIGVFDSIEAAIVARVSFCAAEAGGHH